MYIVIIRAVSNTYIGPFVTKAEAVDFVSKMKNNKGYIALINPPQDGF